MEIGLPRTMGLIYLNPGSLNYLFQAKEMALETNASTNTVKLTIAFLLMFAIVSISFRVLMRSDGALPSGDSAWTINAWHIIEASDKGATVFIPPPWDTRNARLYSQSLHHPGLR